MAKVKTNNRLTASDIIELVSSKSTLTKSQVKECFTEFADLYKSLMGSDKLPEDFTMPLPYVGTFKLKHYNGKKKGTVQRTGNFQYGGYTETVIEEDQPDFNLPAFVVKPEIRSMRKEASKKQWLKEQNEKKESDD